MRDVTVLNRGFDIDFAHQAAQPRAKHNADFGLEFGGRAQNGNGFGDACAEVGHGC
jgi:hypothetical protein